MKSFATLLAALLLLTTIALPSAGATTYAVTVKTDTGSYTGAQTLTASGAVSPAPGPGTAVFLKITGPSSGSPLAVKSADVGATTGLYQTSFVLGGTSSWVSGTYTLSVSWGTSQSSTVNASTTFIYSPATTTTTTTTTSTTQTLPPGVHVTILNGAASNTKSPGFSPANITLVIGVNNTVTWVNNDTAVHTATETDKGFNSGDIAPHAFWSFNFTVTGVFPYICIYHAWMKGSVTVKAAGGATTTTTTTTTTSSTSTTSTSSTTTTTTTSVPAPTSTTTSTTSTTSLQSSTGSSSGGVPEFTFQLLAVSLFTTLVVASYALTRRRHVTGGLIGKPHA